MDKIIGLGNALVDILVKMQDDKLLEELNLPKGSMQLIDADTAKSIATLLETYATKQVSGGSAANTIFGIAQLGGSCGYIGKIQDDELGNFYKSEMENKGIETFMSIGTQDTGRANTFISPDSERTFATYLGAAVEMTADEILEETFKGYKYLHVEGYLMQNYDLIEKAVKIAKKAGLKVSIDLASYNVVEANVDFLKRILNEYIDIVFANEEEAKALTQKEPAEALELIGCFCELAIVKIGSRGSLIKRGEEKYEVGVIPCNPVDTTGAGDQYAAGFLFGLSEGYDIKKCGKLGALMAGKVIEEIGARVTNEKFEEIKEALPSL